MKILAVLTIAILFSSCTATKLEEISKDKLIYGPAITINAYTNEQITWTNTNCVTLSGTASVDSGTVTAVKVIYNGNTYTAQGTTSWTFDANNMDVLATNTFTVYAVSSTGQNSPVNTFKIGVDTLDPAGLSLINANIESSYNFYNILVTTNNYFSPYYYTAPAIYAYGSCPSTNGIFRIVWTNGFDWCINSIIPTPAMTVRSMNADLGNARLYVCADDTLYIYQNDNYPTLRGTVTATFGNKPFWKIYTTSSYLLTGGQYFRIYTKSDSPSLMKEVNASSYDFETNGNYVYIVGSFLSTIDISTPASASIVSTLSNYYYCHIEQKGNFAYCLGLNTNLTSGYFLVLNISTPSSPVLITNYAIDYLKAANATSFYIVSNYAYIVFNSNITILNISNPSNISLHGSYNLYTYPASACYFQSTLYTAAWANGGFSAYSITNPATPMFIQNKYNNDSRGIVLGDNNIYTVTSHGELKTFRNYNYTNISLYSKTVFASHLENYYNEMMPFYYPFKMAVKGCYLYSINHINGLNIFNYSETPSLVKNINTSLKAMDFDIYSDYLYLADRDNIRIINISIPMSASVINSVSLGEATSVSVKENYLYALNKGTTLFIYNITSPASPSLLTSYTIASYNQRSIIRVSGNIAFVGVDSTFMALDVSDPSNSYQFFTANMATTINDIYISGRYVFLALSNAISIYDMGNLSNITEVRNIDLASSGNAYGVIRKDNAIYIADDQKSLLIYK